MGIDRYLVHKYYVVVFEKQPQHSSILRNFLYVSYNNRDIIREHYIHANRATFVRPLARHSC